MKVTQQTPEKETAQNDIDIEESKDEPIDSSLDIHDMKNQSSNLDLLLEPYADLKLPLMQQDKSHDSLTALLEQED